MARGAEPLRIEIHKHVNRPVADAFAWCTDFQETDDRFTRTTLRERRILVRTPDVIEFEDRGIVGPSSVAR